MQIMIRQALILAVVVLSPLSASFAGELTLETGERPGELFFLWQEKLTQPGARSHRLSDMAAFNTVYAKWLIDELEVLEVRELDTDQPLKFSYVVPPKASGPVSLRDVVWYYPNPIPSGGRARVQIRGRLLASKIFSGDNRQIRIDYESRDGVFLVVPLGFALTYCNSPVIVYEKNARTVCSFSSNSISLIAKNIQALAASREPPTISRVAAATSVQSRLPFQVADCHDHAVLDEAEKRLSGSRPVFVTAVDPGAANEQWLGSINPNTTLIWKVNNVVVSGKEGFEYLASNLEIGSEATLHLAEVDAGGKLATKGTIEVSVLSAKR